MAASAGLGGFGYGGFGGLGGYGYGGYGGFGRFRWLRPASAISVSTEYCEVNESRDTSLTRFQRLSAQLFQPYAI